MAQNVWINQHAVLHIHLAGNHSVESTKCDSRQDTKNWHFPEDIGEIPAQSPNVIESRFTCTRNRATCHNEAEDPETAETPMAWCLVQSDNLRLVRQVR